MASMSRRNRLSCRPTPRLQLALLLKCGDAPLAVRKTEPAWNGTAIVLGSDAVAESLIDRLQESGVGVVAPTVEDDLDQVLTELTRILRIGAGTALVHHHGQ